MNRYFAAWDTPLDEVLTSLNRKIDAYYEDLRTRGTLYLWRRAYSQYYRSRYNGGKITKVGDELEFKKLDVNHYANVLQHQITAITQSDVEWNANAVNSTVQAQAQAKFGTVLMDSEVRHKNISEYVRHAMLYASLYGEGHIKVCWDYNGGPDFISTEMPLVDQNGQVVLQPKMTPEGMPILNPDGTQAMEPVMQPVEKKAGDTKYEVFHPLDVVRDVHAKKFDHSNWRCFRSWQNRYDLIAEYPELRDKILSASTGTILNRDELIPTQEMDRLAANDMVYVWEFFHKDTPSVPGGRYVKFVGTDVVLDDMPNPYHAIPSVRFCGQEMDQFPLGWTSNFDLLPLQDYLTKLYSAIATNQLRHAVGVIIAPKGSGFSVSTLSKGMKLIEYDPRLGKPETLNFLDSRPELFSMIDKIESVLSRLSSVSDVMQGDPAASVRSGNMLEIILAQNAAFFKGLERSYMTGLEKLGTLYIKIMQKFADAERPATLMGTNGKYFTRLFKADDLKAVDRIYVKQASSVQKTTAGKLGIARDLLNSGALKDPREFIQLVNTGNLDTTIDPDTMDYMLIQDENERLLNGEMVPTSPTDYLAAHGYHHSVIFSDPDVRRDPIVFQNGMDHIGSHAIDAGFIAAPPQPVLDEMGMPMVDEMGMPMQTPPQPDIVGYLNWCRMIMNAPPSGSFQMAQQAMMMGAQGMAPPAQKMQIPKSQSKTGE